MRGWAAAVAMVVIAGAGAAGAEEAPTLAEALSGIEGAEVHVTGRLERFSDSRFTRLDARPGEGFPVEFALSRDDLRRVEDCLDANPVDWKGYEGCAATFKAEISLNGSQVRLLIFEMVSEATPAPLSP